MKVQAVLKPNSRHRQEVVENPDGAYIIYTKAPAIEGRANAEAIALLARHFGVAKSQVELARGATSKHKTFSITLSTK